MRCLRWNMGISWIEEVCKGGGLGGNGGGDGRQGGFGNC